MTTKERPIIFSGPMVRAILEGKKTQTRRVIKRQCDMEFDPADPHFGPYWLSYATKAEGEDAKVRCPYGEPGDQLWVREGHAITANPDLRQVYRLDHPEARCAGPRVDVKWRPSIHMPRWASRITLKITDVRVERLQQISEADAMAEGCPLVNPDPFVRGHGGSSASGWFSELWESINGEGSWDVNPWVWVVEFWPVEVAA